MIQISKKKNDPQGLLCSDDELVHSPNYTKLLKHVHVQSFDILGLEYLVNHNDLI